MGIYIKGMKPPNDCYECPCKKWVDDGCAGCVADGKIHNASKPIDCPLVEIPEHGRLIDLDKLLRDATRYVSYPPHYEQMLARSEVEHAPTVIEAEGSEDE